uniref:BHLH domain-containing protein n=1 Tax=Gopherus agassizii TaxID=38772 RepID=A0A452GTL5_9SAUR
MEKKRRARINVSLEQLKALLEKHYSHHIRKRKLEKADILELSVKYMKSLQNSVQGKTSVALPFHAGGRGACRTDWHRPLHPKSRLHSGRTGCTRRNEPRGTHAPQCGEAGPSLPAGRAAWRTGVLAAAPTDCQRPRTPAGAQRCGAAEWGGQAQHRCDRGGGLALQAPGWH